MYLVWQKRPGLNSSSAKSVQVILEITFYFKKEWLFVQANLKSCLLLLELYFMDRNDNNKPVRANQLRAMPIISWSRVIRSAALIDVCHVKTWQN